MKRLLTVFVLNFFVFSFFSSIAFAESYNQIMEKQENLIQSTPLSEIQEKAKQGDRNYIYLLGLCYAWGEKGLAKDLQKAEIFFLKAAELGQPDAECHLGAKYFNAPIQSDKSAKEAYKWFYRSANHGNLGGIMNLGYCYETGIGTEKNLELSIDCYRKAAERGAPEAQYKVAFLLLRKDGVVSPEVIRWLKAASEKKYPASITLLATCYEHGDGVEKNMQEAIRLYEIAIKYDDPVAQFALAIAYLRGNGVKCNIPLAIDLLKKSAAQGYANAMYDLGVCYLQGEGVPKDFTTARSLFEKAAQKGHGEAAFNLFVCYYNGEFGCSKDDTLATKWLEIALKNGSQKAAELMKDFKE